MKKWYSFALLLICMLIFVDQAFSQSRNRSRRDEPTFKEKLWYGGSFGLGFQSFDQQSSFLLALFPMAGYKFTEELSIGPRLGLTYQYIKTRAFNGEIYQFHPVELSGALFGRVKVFNQFFGHLEYELTSEKDVVYFSGIPEIIKSSDNNFYVGGGFSSGGPFATELYLLYNVLQDANTLDVPFTIRFGFTWNY